MADYTDEVQRTCEIQAVFAIDVLDVRRRLSAEHVSLDETMADCGCGSQKCAELEDWINKYRVADGREELPGGTIRPSTTIREVIGHVCS